MLCEFVIACGEEHVLVILLYAKFVVVAEFAKILSRIRMIEMAVI